MFTFFIISVFKVQPQRKRLCRQLAIELNKQSETKREAHLLLRVNVFLRGAL